MPPESQDRISFFSLVMIKCMNLISKWSDVADTRSCHRTRMRSRCLLTKGTMSFRLSMNFFFAKFIGVGTLPPC